MSSSKIPLRQFSPAQYAEALLSILILSMAFTFVALGPDIPWPPVLELGAIGVWTQLIPAGALAIVVLGRVFSGNASVRRNSWLVGLGTLTLVSSLYAVVAPYVQNQNVFVAILPPVLLSLVLSVVLLSQITNSCLE
jgi:hypothetical protein